ncbi:hypothetical protein DFH09DRAFT_1334842 [Mycena vulgaris]|nr:hypothetical protein DFH09DRAFT_1334842 [Mycena vulgaris]
MFVGSKSLHARYAAWFLVAAGKPLTDILLCSRRLYFFGAFSPGLVAVNTAQKPRTQSPSASSQHLNIRQRRRARLPQGEYTQSDRDGYLTGPHRRDYDIHEVGERATRRGAHDHRLDGLTPAEEAQLGHLHPKFRSKL